MPEIHKKPLICLAPLLDNETSFRIFLEKNLNLISKDFYCWSIKRYIDDYLFNNYGSKDYLCFGMWTIDPKDVKFGFLGIKRSRRENYDVFYFDNWIEAKNFCKKEIYNRYEK